MWITVSHMTNTGTLHRNMRGGGSEPSDGSPLRFPPGGGRFDFPTPLFSVAAQPFSYRLHALAISIT